MGRLLAVLALVMLVVCGTFGFATAEVPSGDEARVVHDAGDLEKEKDDRTESDGELVDALVSCAGGSEPVGPRRRDTVAHQASAARNWRGEPLRRPPRPIAA